MSTDPTQPMSPPASGGSGSPEQPEPAHPAVPETVPQPSFQPARPTFTPAQRGSQQAQPGPQQAQPGSGRAQPDSGQGEPGSGPAQSGAPGAQQAQPGVQPGPPTGQGGWQQDEQQQARWQQENWEQEPPRQGPQPGWPPGARRPRRRRRFRRWTMAIFALIVVLILLVIADRVALAVAENDMADQFVSNGLPVKPSVTIEGFPFLTQLAARDFHKVDISASNIPAGPVTITSAKGTLTGLHFNSSFNGATVDQMTVSAFVSFGALAAAGGLGGTGITITPAGPDLLKITAGIGGVLSATEEAKVTQTGPQTISIQVVNNGSPISGILSSFGSYSFTLPKGVPASVRITGVTLNSQGLTVTAGGTHVNLSQPSS